MPSVATTSNTRAAQSPTLFASLFARLFRAKESGLILVILALMAGLTLFGGSKQQRFPVEYPIGSTLSTVEGEEPGSGWELIIALADGSTQRHVSEQPWRIIQHEDGSGRAIGAREVNKFFDTENLIIVTTTASFIAVMAVGMTAIIVLAGIDLSVGSIYALSAMLGAMVLARLDAESSAWITAPVAVLVCGVVGAAAGGFNGAMSVWLRLHPFIITLGTMAIYSGLVFVSNGGQTISGLPDSVQVGFFKMPIGGVYPVPTIIMVLVALAGMFVLARTVFGRQVYAIGGNETAAAYAGIPVGRVKIIVYAISGSLAGLSAAMYIGYYGAAAGDAGNGYELKVIAAAVIGGASLAGGRGSALGAVLGAILVCLLENMMIITDLPQAYNKIVIGSAIVLAVVIDQAKGRMRTG